MFTAIGSDGQLLARIYADSMLGAVPSVAARSFCVTFGTLSRIRSFSLAARICTSNKSEAKRS